MINSTIDKKTLLLSIGTIDIHYEKEELPSTSGPSTGVGKSIFISFENTRVRLLINSKSAIKGKIISNNNVYLYYNNKFLLKGTIENIVLHCPQQAYITISEKCIYNCQFCAVPKVGNKIKTKEEILNLLSSRKMFNAISITSGVFHSPETDFLYIKDILSSIKKIYSVPIGVSIVPFQGCSLLLKKIGVSEVKYNIETFNFKDFQLFCPDLSYKVIIHELLKAVSLFGKGHVFTNIIIGLKEDDITIQKSIEYFAKHGIITNLRPLTTTIYQNKFLNLKKPSFERLKALYNIQRNIFEKYGLLKIKSLTMCSKCGGCDINPIFEENIL